MDLIPKFIQEEITDQESPAGPTDSTSAEIASLSSLLETSRVSASAQDYFHFKDEALEAGEALIDFDRVGKVFEGVGIDEVWKGLGGGVDGDVIEYAGESMILVDLSEFRRFAERLKKGGGQWGRDEAIKSGGIGDQEQDLMGSTVSKEGKDADVAKVVDVEMSAASSSGPNSGQYLTLKTQKSSPQNAKSEARNPDVTTTNSGPSQPMLATPQLIPSTSIDNMDDDFMDNLLAGVDESLITSAPISTATKTRISGAETTENLEDWLDDILK